MMTVMRVRAGLVALQHDPDTPPGLLEDWAADRGIGLSVVRVDEGQPLPDPTAYAGTVILGSEHTAYDDTLPWLAAELDFVDRALAADVPVFGICFGGQVLARVLGAQLYRMAEREIGWTRLDEAVAPVPAGRWVAFHRDAFELPAGARELARNEFSLQAFALGHHLAVQFHPEVTAAIAADWSAAAPPPAKFPPADDAVWLQAADSAMRLFDGWAAAVRRPEAAPAAG
jgi:GMP synthase-like glutamine amidotransferase